MKEEWKNEQERFNVYRAHLAEAEDRLAGGSKQRHTEPGDEEHESQRKEYKNLDPGTLPKDMSQLDWSIWQAKLDKYMKASTKGGKPSDQAKQRALESRLGPY